MIKLSIFVLICGFSACTASAQVASDLRPEDREAISSLLQQTMKLTDEQKLLDALLGKWKLTGIADPEQGQNGMVGEAVTERISMDNFVEERLNFGGPQFAIIWRGVYGFDPLGKQFTATWFTNLNTIAFRGVAEVSPNQKTLSFRLSHPFIARIEEATESKTSFVYRITIVDQQKLKFQLIEMVQGQNAVTEVVKWQVHATKSTE